MRTRKRRWAVELFMYKQQHVKEGTNKVCVVHEQGSLQNTAFSSFVQSPDCSIVLPSNFRDSYVAE